MELRGSVQSNGQEVTCAQLMVVTRRDEHARMALRSQISQKPSVPPLIVVTDQTDFVRGLVPSNLLVDLISIREPVSAGCAKNVGLRAARGADLVFLLDDDDLSAVNRCAVQKSVFTETTADVLFGNVQLIDEEGKQTSRRLSRFAWSQSLNQEMLWRNPIHHSSVALRPEVVLSAGGYREDMRRYSDYELWLRLLAGGARFLNQGETVLGTHRIHDKRLTNSAPLPSDVSKVNAARRSLANQILPRGASSLIATLASGNWTLTQRLRYAGKGPG